MQSSKVYYNKLVRDVIPDKIKGNGEACEVRVIADVAEFEQELLKKVQEEAYELSQATNRQDFLSEYADLMTVLDALTQHYELSEADIRVALTENVTRKGLYKERFFLHWSAKGDYQANKTPQRTE